MKRTAVLAIAALLCLFCFAGIASATELIQDGDFSETTSSGFSKWTVTTAPAASEYTSTNYAKVKSTSGSGAHFQLSAQAETVGNWKTSTASVSQQVNLNNADTLTFKTKKGDSYGIYTGQTIILTIMKGDTVVGQYTFDNLGSTDSWTTQTVDLSQHASIGTAQLKFSSSVTSSTPISVNLVDFYITDVSAIESAPVKTSSSLSNGGIIQSGSSISLTYVYSGSPVANSHTYINWGDNQNYYTYDGLSGTQSHTYNSPGTYTVSFYAVNAVGQSATSTMQVDVVTLDFSVYGSSSGNVPFDAQFTYTASDNIAGLSWNFGDGGTSVLTTQPVSHTYTTEGTYSVTLTGTTSLGRSITVTKSNIINTANQFIGFGTPSYDVGSTVTINWALRAPDFSTKTYRIYVYPANADGSATSQNSVFSYTIPNAQTTSTTWVSSGIPGGYYSAYLYEGSSDIVHSSPAVNMIARVTLTVNLAAAGSSYMNSTTVTLFKNGVTVGQPQTTTTGTTAFSNIETGTYQVQAVTAGYATQTATVVLSESVSITIDFVTGTTDDTGTGMGNQYAATYVTFRCYDSGTGKPLSGVTVNVVGVEPTNPIEWMANLFGSAWGSKMIGTNLTGTSDDNGVVTFAMVPNVRYQITLKYGTYSAEKVFQPSTLTGEYPLELDITKWDTTNKYDKIVTTVTPLDDKIIANYTDNTQTTQALNISLYTIEDDKRIYLTSQAVTAQTYSATFTPESPSGKSYVITINATTTALGKITREYGVDFNGPRIKIGTLPDQAYILLSFLILVMVGAVGTMVTSRMYTLVVVIVAAFLWYAGWLFALGTVGSIVLLLCFVLAIIYYIAHKSGGGD